MNFKLKAALGVFPLFFATQALAQITFYEGEGFRGRAFTTNKQVGDFGRSGFNDRASSVIVEGGRWEVCENARFEGRCMVLKRGNYETLTGIGLNDRISSVRMVDDRRSYPNEAPVALAAPSNEYRRRANEAVYDAPVTSVRAVVGKPEERCWVEHQQVESSRGNANVPGAIAGALIGGILGHQVGNGRGNDVATAGGAVVGGLVGSNVGRGNSGTSERDVRRCETTANTTPEYWDVTYNYKGAEHRVQMSAPPGRTVPVNRNGEPRG